jgi:dihydroxyacetone kinase-like protein
MTFDTVSLADLRAWLQEYARLIGEHREELTALDAAIGDADHGSNMDRGMSAAVSGLGGETVAELFKQVGMTLVSTVGGASGPLYGTLFLRFGVAAGEVDSLAPPAFAAALRAGLEGVVARGKAEPGDKTMFDALEPAVTALEAGQDGAFADALKSAAAAAEAGRDATTDMLAHKGRASYLGERSVGHQDPGATSAALLIRAAAETLG